MNDTINYVDFRIAIEKLRPLPPSRYIYIPIHPVDYRQIKRAFHKYARYQFMSHGKHGLKRPRK